MDMIFALTSTHYDLATKCLKDNVDFICDPEREKNLKGNFKVGVYFARNHPSL
ncbi:hypothetical protein WKT22_03516 [Candidatus Lokiarchaeum ossiferum]